MASAILAVILSFFIPGLGQLYTGQFLKAVGFVIASIGLAHLSSYIYMPLFTTGTLPSLSNNIIPLIAFIGYFALWIYSMYDAYCAAKSH